MPWDTPLNSFVRFEFVQDANTLGTTPNPEKLVIRVERQMPGESPFLVIKTKGWSFDSPADLIRLLEKCLQGATVHDPPLPEDDTDDEEDRADTPGTASEDSTAPHDDPGVGSGGG